MNKSTIDVAKKELHKRMNTVDIGDRWFGVFPPGVTRDFFLVFCSMDTHLF